MSIVHIPIGLDRRLIDALSELTAQLSSRLCPSRASRIQARVHVKDVALFTTICKMMAKYTGWEDMGNWQERIVYFYGQSASTIVEKTAGVRSVVVREQGRVRARFDNDTRLGPVDFVLEDLEDPDTTADCVLPSQVAVAYYREYRQGNWKFVVVKRWSADTLKNTFAQMSEATASQQIWFTLCDAERYVQQHPSIYVAVSFLMKASALMQNRLCLTLLPVGLEKRVGASPEAAPDAAVGGDVDRGL